MNTKNESVLMGYLSVYGQNVQDVCLHLRNIISAHYPDSNQLVYDGYNAVSIAFSLSDQLKDAFCHLAVYRHHVNFGLNRGAEIKNPPVKLEGGGKLIRHYKVKHINDISEDVLKELLDKARDITLSNSPDLKEQKIKGSLIIMPTSGKKVRPKP